MAPRILVTGAGGFLGGAVARALAANSADFAELRLLVRRRPAPTGERISVVHGDLARPDSMRGVCDGIDTILHLATYVGPEWADCDTVNRKGTRNLLREARRAGVREIVYVSTAAVHGHGPHVAVEERRPPAPISPASRTRLAAERMVLAEGGVVLRPFYVYGDGDRWFIPTLLRWFARMPSTWIDGGRGRQSVVSIDDFACAVAAVARHPRAFGGGVPFHVCEPEPVEVREMGAELARILGVRIPALSIPYAAVRALPPLTRRIRELRRQAERMGLDHWYVADRFWGRARFSPALTMRKRLAAYAPWYRQFAQRGTS